MMERNDFYLVGLPLALVDFDFHFCKYHFWHTRGPGSLLRRPAGGLKLEAGLQPGAQQVAGEAGHAGGELAVHGDLEGNGHGLGRPEVATLRAGGITDYNSLFCFRDLLFVFKIERKMNGRLNS